MAVGRRTGLSRNGSPGSAGWARRPRRVTMTAALDGDPAGPERPAPALGSGRRHAAQAGTLPIRTSRRVRGTAGIARRQPREGRMTAVLEAHGFGKRYRRRIWALRNVELTVPAGTITALVGPNGSGKSTLIRAWIGFERATEGRLSTGGVDPQRDRKGAVKRVGYV